MTKLRSRRKLRPKVVETPGETATPFPLRPEITKKKARTKLHRQHRSRISPILFSPSNPAPPPLFTPILSVDEIPCFRNGRAVTVAAAAGDHDRDGELSPESRKRKLTESEAAEERPESSPADRTIIKRYYSKRRQGARPMAGNGVNDQASELSRVATYSDLGGAGAGSIARVREMKNGAGDSNSVLEKLGSNTRELGRVRSEVKQSEDEISWTPEVHESCMMHKSRSEFPKQEADEISVDESAFVDQTPNSLAGMEGELACLEQFSRQEVESTFLDTGSQFSQKADSADSSSSPTRSGLVVDTDLPEKSSVISSSPLLFSSLEFSSLLLSSIFLASSVLVFDLLVTFCS